jgi:hypothetical protein
MEDDDPILNENEEREASEEEEGEDLIENMEQYLHRYSI